LSEWRKIAMLRDVFSTTSKTVPISIGDDAAVLDDRLVNVVTVDAQVEHVHFERDWLSLRDLGYRAIMTAASDLAAMRATPSAAVVALTLPEGFSDTDLEQLSFGQRDAAKILRCAIVGGNLSRGRDLSLTTTALGHTHAPLLRSGAQVGDTVYLAGEVGLAAAGLRQLQQGRRTGVCVDAWRRPCARMDVVPSLGAATAGIDVSDGLAQDLAHLALASHLRIELDGVPQHAEVLAFERLAGLPAYSLALYGGEDYALLVTSPLPLIGFVPIGRCVQGAGVSFQGTNVDAAKGFDHFAAF
jgi:thiamine-monophosphate kinase